MLPASPHAHLAVQACIQGMDATAASKDYITSGFMTSSTPTPFCIFFKNSIIRIMPFESDLMSFNVSWLHS